MSLYSKLDQYFGAGASSRGLPIAATALTGLLLAISGASISFSQMPLIRKAPKPQHDEPYPHDIFEGGRDLDTPYGTIRYFETGPENGKKILLVHGISTPSPIWRGLLPQLVKAGYRVLCYDLPGRGYSDSPQVPHDTALFVSQIALLLAALPHWTKFSIIGMSLGGPISCAFASYFPDRIQSIFLVCPAGATPTSELSIKAKVLRSGFISVGLLQALAGANLSPIPLSRDVKTVGGWQLKNHPGFLYSFASSLRSGPLFGNRERMQKVVDHFGPKVEAVWGDKDEIVPLSSSKYLNGLKVRIVPDAGHFMLVTHPEKVSTEVLDFLSKATA